MSATVEVATGGDGAGGLRLPLTALMQHQGGSSVWIVENGAVRQAAVQVTGQVGNDVLVTGALRAGQSVVTAGVNLLKNGQKVRILTADISRRADTEAEVSGQGAPAGAAK
jgi:prophage tail gpP-like protein